MKPAKIIAGDTGPFEFVLSDENGPVRLSAGSTVTWLMGSLREDVILPSHAAAAVVLDDGTDALKGHAHFIAGAGETDVPGVYGVQFLLTYPGGATAIFPSDEPEELVIGRRVA